MKKYLFIFLSFVYVSGFCQSTDSSKTKTDSLKAIQKNIEAASDSAKGKSYDVDTVINASASDSLIFHVVDKQMDLFGHSEVEYQQTDLKSAKININFNTHELVGVGEKSDTAKNKLINTPVLTEDGQVYTGNSMRYNFKTGRGFISMAGTKSQGAIYTGEKIKKISKSSYFIKDGIYTTCDKIPPDYYFSASEMKIIQNEEVAAKWILLYVGGVPMPLPIPFAVFPLQSGRRSGIITPAFGYDGTYGNYFKNFGYFWAINDYMDLAFTADYWTRGSFTLNSRFRYALRYNYTGSFTANYSFKTIGEPTDIDRSKSIQYRIMWSHNQTIDPTLRFDANLEFVSGNYIQQNVTDLSQLLTNQIVSNATLFKSWDSGNSLSLSYSRTQDLESGDIDEILPNLTFTLAQSYPFKSTSTTDQKWYETFGYQYNGQFENTRNKDNGDLAIRGGIDHNIRASLSPKFDHISFTPFFNYEERWYNKAIEEYDAGLGSEGVDSIVTKDIHQINFVRTFNAGVSASTKLYGIFNINNFGIEAFRHTLIPTISYSYQPDFSKPGWGYYNYYINSEGNRVEYDKFQNEIFGGPSMGEQQNISLSLSNIFEMKTQADPTDTTSKENKIQLLNLTAAMNYNFAADSLKFSNLNLGYRTQVGSLLNFFGSSSFSPYDYSNAGNTINKFLINEGKGLFRLTNFQFSISTSLSGQRTSSSTTSQSEQQANDNLQQAENSVYKGIYDEAKQSDFTIPWDVSLTYNYDLSRPTPLSMVVSSNIEGGFNFNLTPSWKLSFSGSYDIRGRQFAAPEIRISRDLDCWVMNFTWNPIGTYRGYQFEIRVKAPQLQDLKITKANQFYSDR
jgi:lipopolysaccharide assembly outer membrane protein LptD (OstA)